MPAVIFDQDGTLVDLFELHLKGFQTVFKGELGLDFTREDLEETYGQTGDEIISLFLARKGVSADVGALAEKRRRWVVDNLSYVTVLPGVERLLKELKAAGVPMAVGTSNPPKLANAILEACHLASYFRCVFGRDPRIRGKPAPDIFLAAAKGLGADPSECVVVEDSTYGVRAGKAAMMRVLAVATGKHSRAELESEEPDLLVDSLERVSLDTLRSLFK
jgi:beta-phosphoglucomutase